MKNRVACKIMCTYSSSPINHGLLNLQNYASTAAGHLVRPSSWFLALPLNRLSQWSWLYSTLNHYITPLLLLSSEDNLMMNCFAVRVSKYLIRGSTGCGCPSLEARDAYPILQVYSGSVSCIRWRVSTRWIILPSFLFRYLERLVRSLVYLPSILYLAVSRLLSGWPHPCSTLPSVWNHQNLVETCTKCSLCQYYARFLVVLHLSSCATGADVKKRSWAVFFCVRCLLVLSQPFQGIESYFFIVAIPRYAFFSYFHSYIIFHYFLFDPCWCICYETAVLFLTCPNQLDSYKLDSDD